MPTVSVVIPSYNGAGRLPRLLRSLEQQEGVDWEAIIVLDGSTDDSSTVVGRWSDHAPVSSIALPTNQGRPTALNTGFAAATGSVLVRCDDDLELPPHFLSRHLRHHSGEPVGVAGMCVDVFPETKYARDYGRRADMNIRRAAYAAGPGVSWRFWAANCSVTRETFELVGGYDETYRRYGWEDVDWGYRLYRAGIPIVVAPDVEARHHNPAVSARDRSEKAFASGASRRLFESKHPGSGLPRAMQDTRWTPWNTAVRGAALCMRAGSVPGFALVAEGMSRLAPSPISRKLIGLSVEAAGFAGQRRPRREADGVSLGEPSGLIG
jgi:glycosyltransferase involved in cell wall biosynthesis